MKLANTAGRFVFARDALEEAPPAMDRVELVSELIVIPGLSKDDRFEFTNALGRGELFSSYIAAKNRQSIRQNFLVGGNIQFIPGAQNELRFILKLDLNLTRFVQFHDCPVEQDSRRHLQNHPLLALDKYCSSVGMSRLDTARRETLDRSDNYITELSVSRSKVTHWKERFEEYLSIVLSAVAEELYWAMGSIGANPDFTLEVANELVRQGANWKLRQAEFYWEFAVQNAVSKMQSIASDCVDVLRNGYEAIYDDLENPVPPRNGRDRNAPYVRGILAREGVYGKLYAKAGGVLRFEVQYVKPPAATISSNLRVAGTLSEVFEVLELAEQDASNRACVFWRAFWSRRSIPQIANTSSLYSLIGHIYDACNGTGVAPDVLLALLVAHRNGEPFWPRREGSREPFRNLKAAGVVSQMPNSHNTRPRYELVAEYRVVVERISTFFAEGIESESSLGSVPNNLADEDIVPQRVRSVILRYSSL